MNLQSIQLTKVVASNQPRPLRTAEVDKLAESIKEIGLIQPVTVTKFQVIHGAAEDGWKIVAGHHRVAACRALGWTEIDAIVIEDKEHLQTELIEIDENLCRAELTPAQRTAFSKRRKQIWEALHPVEIQVGQVDPPVIGYASPPPQTQGFASATAAATGQTKRTTNRAIARAEAIGEDALRRIVGTSLDSGVELDALAKLSASAREKLIQRAEAGEVVSAKPSKPAKKTKRTVEPPPENVPTFEDGKVESAHVIESLTTENDALRDRLAVEVMDCSEEEKTLASQTIAELRMQVKNLSAELAAVKSSRDTYIREAGEAKKEAVYWRKQADKLAKVAA